MHPHFIRLFAAALACTALSGCAVVDRFIIHPYRAPDPAQPSVQVSILPPSESMVAGDSELLHRHDVQCPADAKPKSEIVNLATWLPPSALAQPKTVAVPAGRVQFLYVKEKYKRICKLGVSAKLEAGHAYAIKTDGACRFGMVDTTTGVPVQLRQEKLLPDLSSCRKPAKVAAKPQSKPE